MKRVVSVVRGSVVVGVLGAVMTLSSAASARDDSAGMDCVSDNSGTLATVTCTISSGSGESSFLGAVASDNGWTEFYTDDDGEWWVDHNKDGSTTIGWGENFFAGPKLGNSKEGSYNKKPRPALSGVRHTGPKRTYAAAKAAAAKKGTLTSLSSAPVTTGLLGKFAHITMAGSGQCKASIVVTKDGKFVSTTGIVPVSFPSTRAVSLPYAPGTYVITVTGNDGCLGQTKSAQATVLPPARVAAR